MQAEFDTIAELPYVNIFPGNKAKAFTSPLTADSRLLSRAFARVWEELFAERVRTGKGEMSWHVNRVRIDAF
jgi:hypothetical protein